MEISKNIIAYADGSSLGNPGPGGWGALVYKPDTQEVAELGGRDEHTTNNRMELTAAISALVEIGETSLPIILHSDSSYVINGITKWVSGWMKRDWITAQKTPVQNVDLWKELVDVCEGKNISWRHVAGHSGLPGNERADRIAASFAEGKKDALYRGPMKGYPIDVTDVSYDKSKQDTRARSKARAYSYVSLVDGVIMRHATWDECKQRVEGKGNVRFKKTLDAKDEARLMKEWQRTV